MAPKLHQSIMLCLLIALMVCAGAAHAAVGDAITFTLNCNGFVSRGGFLTTDRDNTGRSREAIVISVTDGTGRILYENTSIYPVNQRVTFEDGTAFTWNTQPIYNPLVLHVVSVAGNGQPEQLIYLVTGTCIGLPTYADGVFVIGDDLSILPLYFTQSFAPADGRTGPSVDPNAVPPRPTNPVEIVESQPGYAIVNTDNLFLRTGDGPEYTPVGIIDGGTRLIVLGSNGQFADNDQLWWYVEVGGLRGWVKSEFLYLRGDLRGLPIVPVVGEIIQPTLYVGVRNPIFNSRSLGGRFLCDIPGGQLYNIVAVDDVEPTWVLIEATCDGVQVNGWLPADRGIIRNSGGVPINIVR